MKGYLEAIERAVSAGDVVLLENIEENVDPVLDPLLGRNTIKKGRAIKVSDFFFLNFAILFVTICLCTLYTYENYEKPRY